jgi:hypothetical protein
MRRLTRLSPRLPHRTPTRRPYPMSMTLFMLAIAKTKENQR